MAVGGSSREPASSGDAQQATAKTTRGAVRYRDGRMTILNVLRHERVHLRRAGFRSYLLTLVRNDGSRVQSDLWTQDEPTLADCLNAAHLLFNDDPGSVFWEPGTGFGGPGIG